jgi:putative transposase
MRDQLVDERLFLELDHAGTKIETWAYDYNQRRLHSALAYLTPAAYAANLSETYDQLHRSHTASATPHSAKDPRRQLIAAG